MTIATLIPYSPDLAAAVEGAPRRSPISDEPLDTRVH